MTLKYIWRSFSLGCHFHVHFSYLWHAFASHGLPAIAELLVSCSLLQIRCSSGNSGCMCIVYCVSASGSLGSRSPHSVRRHHRPLLNAFSQSVAFSLKAAEIAWPNRWKCMCFCASMHTLYYHNCHHGDFMWLAEHNSYLLVATFMVFLFFFNFWTVWSVLNSAHLPKM